MLKVYLKLFDGGADAGGGAAAATAGAEAGASDAAMQGQTLTAEGGSDSGSDTSELKAEPKVQDKGKLFDQLIKSEYKDEFAKKTQKIIDQRFKETKQLQERQDKMKPMLDLLAGKYGVKSDDIDGLVKAINDDDSLIESMAMEAGMTVEQYRYTESLRRENAELKRAEEERKRVEEGNRFYKTMLDQSEQVKALYPQFDLEAELQNSTFMEAMRVPGVSVRTAYELAHRDEIIAPAMAMAAQKATEAVTSSIKARGMRPTENGLGNGSGLQVATDVSKMTRAQREEIYKRVVERGEKI